MKFIDTETGTVITLDKLKTAYEAMRDEIELDSGATNFDEYLSNCLSKNGFLEVYAE